MGGLAIDFGLINADNVEQVSFGVTFYMYNISDISYVHFFIMCHFYYYTTTANTILRLTYT